MRFREVPQGEARRVRQRRRQALLAEVRLERYQELPQGEVRPEQRRHRLERQVLALLERYRGVPRVEVRPERRPHRRELQGVALLGWLVRQRAQLVWVLLGLERYLQARQGVARRAGQRQVEWI